MLCVVLRVYYAFYIVTMPRMVHPPRIMRSIVHILRFFHMYKFCVELCIC
jgi:hypothetical protein